MSPAVPRALAILGLSSLALFPRAIGAQEVGDRAAIERLRDSLAGVTDSLALRRLEAATIVLAKSDRDNPLLHLRLGFIAYRLGEIGAGTQHFDDAAGEFDWASQLKPNWPYPWFGLGMSELALGEHSSIAVENLKQQLGLDHLSKAAAAYAHAAEADPSFAIATIDLVQTALSQQIRPRLDVALHAARIAAASPAGRTPALQLARGRVEREVGEMDSARVAFAAYVAAGGDSGVGKLELARTDYAAHRDADGWREYLLGARAATTPAAVAMYRTDASWVARPEELTAFDALPDATTRAAWLRAFWVRRDVEDAREVGQRLAEHYRRWFYVMRNFHLVSRHRHYDITERYRPNQSEIDDRGVIYLRHGPPDARAQYAATDDPGLEPNESWLYRRPPPEGDLVYHFVSRGDVQDFKLVESLVDALSFDRRMQLETGNAPNDVVRGLYASRGHFGPLYERIANGAGSTDVRSLVAQDRQEGQKSIAEGTTTDGFPQEFAEPLGVGVDQFVVGAAADTAAAGGQGLHVIFTIPAGRLTPQVAGDQVIYPLRFRLYVSDLRDSLVGRIDTVRTFATREPLHDPAYLTGQLIVPVPVGLYRYRLLVESPDGFAGAVVVQDSVGVGDFDGRHFAASDLVVGSAGSGLAWLRARDTVLLNPLGRFPAGIGAELYYEVYGLSRGDVYHTEVRLERVGSRSIFSRIGRLFGAGHPPVLLAFDAPADGPVSRVHRGVALGDTPTGDYELTVTVRDPATGTTLTRRHRFQVVTRN